VARIWTDTFGIQDTSLKTPLVTDSLFNTFIAGTVQNTNSGVDVLLRKLDAHGDLIWQSTYTNSGAYRDQATDIALDDSGNVYLCGASYINGNHFDFLVLKFDPNGNLLWDYTYNGSASLADGATALALSNGSVFVTGAATFTGSYIDYLTLRLSASGSLQWQSTYNYVNFADVPFDIVVQDGHVFVTGGSQNNFSDWDYATLQLLETNGSAVDTSRTGGTGIGFEYATEAVMDNNGNYYLTGTFYNNGSKDFKTIKFDANLNVVWAQSFDFDGEDDEAFSVAVDTSGNVYVAGLSSDSSNQQFTIVKYSNTGSQQWVHRSGGINNDRATRIACDESGNIFATGQRHNGSNLDFYTIAIDEQGNVQWSKLFNGGSNGDDKANMIAVEDQYIIVSGTTTINGHQEYISIAYGTFKMSLPPDTGNTVSSSPNWFYPQSGQILDDTLGTADIQYYTLHHGPAMYLKNEQLSFIWSKIDSISSTQDTLQRIDQVVLNSSRNRLYEYEESEDYLNYFLAHCPKGITNVRGYKWLAIPDIYRETDMFYTFNDAGLKQVFVSKPGTKPTIQLKYLGADTIIINATNGEMEILGAIGSFTFAKPYAFEIDAQGNIIPGTQFYPSYHQIQTGIILLDNINYNTSNGLVVVMHRGPLSLSCTPPFLGNIFWSSLHAPYDPNEFNEPSFHSGSNVDINGNVLVVGNSPSSLFPTTISTLNFSFVGGGDATLVKFNDSGTRLFALFYGGSQEDKARRVGNDNAGNIYLLGETTSSNLPTPTLNNTYTNSNTPSINDNDLFLSKISPTGTFLNWASFFGGSNFNETAGEIIIRPGDLSDPEIYIGGYGDDGAPRQADAGNFNETGGGILAKFLSSEGQLLWSTGFGSNGNTNVTGLAFGDAQSLIVTGWTEASDFQIMNSTAFSSYGSAPYATFVMKLDANNNLLWSTFLVKSTGNSKPAVVNNSVYVHGDCDGIRDNNLYSKIFLLNPNDGSYFDDNILQQGPTCSSSIYLTRLSNGGQVTWSTLLGGTYLEKAAGIDFDSFGNIFLSGHTESPDFVPILNTSPGFYYKSAMPAVDFHDGYLIAFDNQNQEKWGTPFGGDYYDVCTDISIDRANSKLYLIGDVSKSSNCFPFKDAQTWFQDDFTQYANTIASFITQFDVSSNFNGQLENSISENDVIIYPNPSSGEKIFIKSTSEISNLKVVDLLGIEQTHNYNKSENTINLSSLSNGTYFICYTLNNTFHTIKFTKI
jgi:hypothetical protein